MFFLVTLNSDLWSNVWKYSFKMSKQSKSFKCISLYDLDEMNISNVQKGWITITIFCMKYSLL